MRKEFALARSEYGRKLLEFYEALNVKDASPGRRATLIARYKSKELTFKREREADERNIRSKYARIIKAIKADDTDINSNNT